MKLSPCLSSPAMHHTTIKEATPFLSSVSSSTKQYLEAAECRQGKFVIALTAVHLQQCTWWRLDYTFQTSSEKVIWYNSCNGTIIIYLNHQRRTGHRSLLMELVHILPGLVSAQSLCSVLLSKSSDIWKYLKEATNQSLYSRKQT